MDPSIAPPATGNGVPYAWLDTHSTDLVTDADYEATAAIHHGMFGVKMKEAADAMGYADCTFSIPDTVDAAETGMQFPESILLD